MSIRIVAIIITLLCFHTETVQADAVLAEQLITKAVTNNLATDRTWQILMHYTRTAWGFEKSRIDDASFFFAPDGRTDSNNELAANIKAIFTPPQADNSYYACRFPARFAWLKARLGITDDQLPPYSCPERDKSIQAVDAKSAVLIFPVGHINSPASMFGHTLLRIDGTSKSSLISHAANYAATTTDTNGLKYAWKGLTGGYKGHYSIMPYYLKVKEYNDLEHRDMWEYRLNLTEPEVQMIVMHLWELHKIQSSYYFIDENCSYNLLFLIEVARPSLQLIKNTGFFVLPSDTIRIVLDSGIVNNVTYRPSQGARIRNLITKLDAQSQETAQSLTNGALPPRLFQQQETDKSIKIKVYDLATDMLQYRYQRNEIDKSSFQKQYLTLLKERSVLGAAPPDDNITAPPAPETGHYTKLLAVSTGFYRDLAFTELRYRPTYHGLLDPDQGYLAGAQIKFFDTAIRLNIQEEQLRLQSLHLLDITSVSPRNRFFKPVSWKVNTGFDQEPLADGHDHLLYRLNTGGGLSWQTPANGIFYLFAEADLNLSEKLRDHVAIAPGASIGLIEHPTDWWKIHLQARSFIFRLGDHRDTVRLDFDQTFRLTQNNSILLQYNHTLINGHQITEATVAWNRYF